MPPVNATSYAERCPTPRHQRPTGNHVLNQAFFANDDGWRKATEEKEFDLVVVGSGFCGYAVVERALKNNPTCKILMLEKGQFFLPSHFQNLPLPFTGTTVDSVQEFPWALSDQTESGQGGPITWQHGMMSFFGGRSTLWSGWCPTPTREEMLGWPVETQDAVLKNIQGAESLLYVQTTDKMSAPSETTGQQHVVFKTLQTCISETLQGAKETIPGIYRTEAAPLASAARKESGIDFEKFSVPGSLLQLMSKSAVSRAGGLDHGLTIATDCVVEKIVHEDGQATALQTSRGDLPLGNASLVLSMGTLPPTTLVSNSFPHLTERVGRRFSGHFITSIVAKIPVEHLRGFHEPFASLEVAACYIGGLANDSYGQQFHIQLSAIWDEDPEKNSDKAVRYMPDVISSASLEQRLQSKGCVVFACAVLGELEAENDDNWFIKNANDSDVTTNSLLQVVTNPVDMATWDFMDNAAFQILENVLCADPSHVTYWHETTPSRGFTCDRPTSDERRASGLVHESSTMHIGDGEDAPVGTDYKLQGTPNVYVTGGSLWPRGGSWNPTLAMVALSQDLADKLDTQ